MKHSYANRILHPFTGMVALVVLLVASAAVAATPLRADGAAREGYLTTEDGTIVVNNYAECWHTTLWVPELAVAGCDPVAAPEESPMPVANEPMQPAEPAPLPARVFFAFDRADLDDENRSTIDAYVRGVPDGARLQVNGFADRIGSDVYNERLSQRRADAVTRILVEDHGIDAARIDVRAFGESVPSTQCLDSLGWAELVRCLQPDRRVDVHVLPTR